MSILRTLVLSDRPAVAAWLEAQEHLSAAGARPPFQSADFILGEDELETLVQAILGVPKPARAYEGWLLESLSSEAGDLSVYVVPDEATKRLAELSEASFAAAASYVVDVEEADLTPAARSRGDVLAERTSWWVTEVLSSMVPLARKARGEGQSLFLVVGA